MSEQITEMDATTALRKRLTGHIPSDRLVAPNQLGSCGVIRPETGTELSQIIKAATAEGLLLHPPGTQIPQKEPYLEIDLRRLSKILDLSPRSSTVTVQSGVLTGTIEQWLRVHGWMLGWYTPSLEEVPLAELIQDARPFLPGPSYDSPRESVRGFHAILPDGREMWNKAAPGRATGPNLLGMLNGGFSFGVITRLVLTVYRVPQWEDEATFAGPSLSGLLTIGGKVARMAKNPDRLLITRAKKNRSKMTKPKWVLRAIWHRTSDEAKIPFEPIEIQSLESSARRFDGLEESEGWGPGLDRANACIRGRLPDALIQALEGSTNSWVIAFEDAHVLRLWPDARCKPGAKDPVRAWIDKEQSHEYVEFSTLEHSILSEALRFRSKHTS